MECIGRIWWQTRKEGNVLFKDTLNTFYLRLYGVRHMVKDHSDCERDNLLPPHGLLQTRIDTATFFALLFLGIMAINECN